MPGGGVDFSSCMPAPICDPRGAGNRAIREVVLKPPFLDKGPHKIEVIAAAGLITMPQLERCLDRGNCFNPVNPAHLGHLTFRSFGLLEQKLAVCRYATGQFLDVVLASSQGFDRRVGRERDASGRDDSL